MRRVSATRFGEWNYDWLNDLFSMSPDPLDECKAMADAKKVNGIEQTIVGFIIIRFVRFTSRLLMCEYFNRDYLIIKAFLIRIAQ